jgi:hypothetical protein
MKITIPVTLKKEAVDLLMKDLNFVVKEIAARHGIIVTKSRAVFGEHTIDLKVAMTVEGGKDKLALNYERHARRLNLPPLKTQFRHWSNGDKCTLVGLRIGGPYKSVVWENNMKGGRYKLPLEDFLKVFKSASKMP